MSRFALVFGVVVSLAASGCAQIAGIDNTTGGGGDDGSGGDGGPGGGASLAFQRFSIGSTIVEAPQPVGGLALPTFFTDAGPVPGVANANGWSTDQTASSVLFYLPTYPAPEPQLWQMGSSNIKGYFATLERPGATPPPMGATVDIELTFPTPIVAGEQYELFDLGAWSVVGLTGTVGATTFSAPGVVYATQFGSITGRPIDSIGAADSIVALRYTGAQLSAVADLPGFDQTAADTITGTLAALTPNLTLNATVDSASGATRLAAALPVSPNPPTVGWNLNAAPGYLLGSTAGPQLNGANPPATDTTVTATYANPFAATHNWQTAFTWVINTSRTYTPTVGALAGQAIGLAAELFTLREPGDGTVADHASLDAGMPTMVTLGATQLTSDGIVLGDDPTTPLTVTFTSDVADNTLYQVQVIETSLVAGAQQNAVTFNYMGVLPTFQLPANTLVAGHTYRLRALCRAGGYPTLAAGDLTNTNLPVSLGLLDSGVFSVGTPQ